jgi:gluconolactonase
MTPDAAFPPLPEARWAGSPVRYPDPAIRVLDPRFERYRIDSAAVERLATGCRWAEGPVWFGDHRCLLFSDIPNDRILRWDEQTGQVTTFRAPSRFANGGTRDRSGRLVTCEHLTRQVTRTEHDGRVTVLADSVDGRRLNAPNDVVVSTDGAVWFTDPGYGIGSDYEGDRAEPELPTRVYRIDPVDGTVEGVIDMSPGTSDGIRCDVDGNLWSAAAGGGDGYDGVHVFAADGTRIGQVLLPEQCANLCFGGRRNNRLFMTAGQSVYSVYVNATGL